MRVFVSSCLFLSLSACVDAPITAAHIQADGQLISNLQASNASSTETSTGRKQIAKAPQIYGVISSSRRSPSSTRTWKGVTGPLNIRRSTDLNKSLKSPVSTQTIEFPASSRKHGGMEVFLHLRSLGLKNSRTVNFVWIHGDSKTHVRGHVKASAGYHLASNKRIRLDQIGPWRVEVLAQNSDGASLVFAQNFVVTARPS